jgi:O-antigen/teichoic acid export membrane protein
LSANELAHIIEKPVETGEHDRGRERIRRIHLTAVVTIGFRGAMLLSSLLYIPATVYYLGPARYGLWVAMTSVITLLSFADCGLGFSLMNDVAHSIGHGSDGAVRRAISSTFFLLAGIGILGCLLFAFAYPFIPWQQAYRTTTPMETAEAARATAIIIVGFLLTLPFTTVQRVQSAHQEGYKTQIWEIGGVIFSVLGLLLAIRVHAGLPALVIAFSFGPLMAMVLNWIVYFGFRRRPYFPRLRDFDLRLVRRISVEGWYFLVMQIATIAAFSVDNLIVLHYYGQTAFGKYVLVLKVFQVAQALGASWLAALWPAYAEAIARGDGFWVRRTLMRSTAVSALGAAAVSIPMAILAGWAVRIWTGTEVNPTPWLLTGLVLYTIIVIAMSAVSAYLNGTKYIKGQAAIVTIHAGVSVLFKVLLCKYAGISGAVWGSNLAYLLVMIPAYCVIVPRLTRTLRRSG